MDKVWIRRMVVGVFAFVSLACAGGGGGIGQMGDGNFGPAFMAFVSYDSVTNDDIILRDSDGDLMDIATSTFFEREPALSPDGTKVVFSTNQSGSYHLWVKTVNGPAPTQLTSGIGSDEFPSWSPDGTQIVFTRRTDMERIYRINADGSNLTQLTSGEGFDARYSPDGTKIYFGSFQGGTNSSDIFVMNADGSNQTQLTSTPLTNDYLPIVVGNQLVYVGESIGNANASDMMTCDLTGANVQVLIPGNGGFVDFPASGTNGEFYYSLNSNIYMRPSLTGTDTLFQSGMDGSLAGG